MKTGVLVVGPARSGTSLVCSVLRAHGVDFGSEVIKERIKGSRGVLGYEEDPVFQSLLDVQIAGSGGWCNGTPKERILPLANVSVDRIREDLLRDKAGDLVGLKNGNVVYGFPWWFENVFSGWGEWHYVAVLRHPVETAISQQHMKYRPYDDGFSIWKRTYQDILLWEYIYGIQFHFVHYPDMMGIGNIASALGISIDVQVMADLWQDGELRTGPTPTGFEHIDRFYERLRERTNETTIDHRHTLAG